MPVKHTVPEKYALAEELCHLMGWTNKFVIYRVWASQIKKQMLRELIQRIKQRG